ncbi:9489_t:CDS:10 [Funneliformis mosseae]|uniref:9489_t:CDS:1 n=1 Tax=Funneliformis mosseae TaxID=27381 RepID=A0A9N8WT66_FUNMO|nr:9489_t:CDS:10 [Funneliformis mosseae]
MEDNVELHEKSSHASYPTLSPFTQSSPISIPTLRTSRPASPHLHHMSKVHKRGTPSPPIESSTRYNISQKQQTPEIIVPKDYSSPPEIKRRNSSFYQELSIHLNQPVGSMSISPSSRDVVLAARKGLFIIDLENPYETPRELHHLTKWEVADVQWNPHQCRRTWVASTSNQKGLIWNLALPSSNAVEQILHGHSRAISDINWHPLNPDELATCSVDTYVHLWDLRTPKKPTISFCAWTAGATHVKFNKKNEYLLASAHDRDLLIWDTRKGSLSITSIRAHTTKIYGIDWSRKSADNIITCSLDKSVKFWNIKNDVCQGVIYTNSPVWRARHTPVGNGILTMSQRSETSLYLWNQENPQSHVHAFEGHSDVVKEFVWRIKSDGDPIIDDRELQLITWSKDKHLRLWPINDKLLKLTSTGHSTFTFRDPPPTNNHSASPTLSTSASHSSLRVIPGNRMNTITTLRPSGASTGGGNIKSYMGAAAGMYRAERHSLSPLLWMQNVRMVKPSGEIGSAEDIPTNMHEEWATVSKKFSNVEFEKLNVQGRSCTISLHGPWSDSGVAFIRINITFPSQYPDKVAPIFDIQKTGMISIMNRTHMSQILNRIASSHVSQKRPCLEACIRYLLGEHPDDGQERYGRDDSDDENYINSTRRASYDKNLTYILGDKDYDNNIPFPKLCGAKFCVTGKLVCFFSSLRSPDASNPVTPVRSNGNSGTNRGKTSYIYTHPRSYDSWEQYKMISRLPRPVTRYGADGDDSSYEVDDDQDDLLLYFNPKSGLRNNAPDSSTLAGHVIHTYDFSEWMPVNRKLANEYILHGDDPVEICKYNARVAADNDRPDLEQVWLLASLILSQTVSIKRFKNSLSSDDIIPIERNSGPYQKCANKRKESRNGYDSFMDEAFHEFFGRLDWGFHPFGKGLAIDMLNHFVSIGDIQTAAMLSCVFRQPFPPHRKLVKTKEIQPLISPDLETYNISSSTDYFNYYARYPEKRNPYQLGFSSISGATFVESFNSSKSSWGNHYNQSEMFGHFVNAGTPPTPSGYIYGHSEGAGGPIMVPSAGHTSHHQRRSTFGGISKEANFFSSSFSTTASPPKTPKRDSPVAVGFTSHFGWGTMGVNQGNERLVETSSKKSSDLTFIPCNFEEFDDERRPFQVSLLDDKRATNARYDQIRLAYAEILYHWGLFEARTEILKFMKFVKTTIGSPLGEQQEPLEIGIHCFQCGIELKGNYKCGNCLRKRAGIKCSVCHQTIRGLSNFCIICSHGGHTKHLREWFKEGNKECPSGCGCQCIIKNGGFGFDEDKM